ncbi:MAG: PilZ domain-containing protein [Planctomycetales bacterium]|nr:PilZ domain-containing protein [Planctomycetales bacterium]
MSGNSPINGISTTTGTCGSGVGDSGEYRSAGVPSTKDRTTPRFRVFDDRRGQRWSCHLSFRPTPDVVQRVPVDLVDLNTNGCAIRYRLPRAIPGGNGSTMLEIKNLSSDETFQMLARVCWSRQTGLDQFSSGLYFRRSLPGKLILSGVREGSMTRRVAERVATNAAVTIRQSDPQLTSQAAITSASMTGVQIVGTDALTIGSRLMLQLADGTAVVGTTVWSSERESQFAAGVAFIKLATGRGFFEAVRRV